MADGLGMSLLTSGADRAQWCLLPQCLLALMLVTLLAVSGCQPPEATTAELVIRNASIQTMDTLQPRAQALAIRAGRLLFVGSDAEVERWIGATTTVQDLHGATILPGFIDTHIHPIIGADQLEDCSLDDVAMSLPAMQPLLAECLQRLPADNKHAWLAVINLNSAGFAASAAELDQLISDRPFALFGADGHTAWLNSAGLRAAGITAATPDPSGGRIVRDASGKATGQLIDTAVELAYSQLPVKSLNEKVRLTERVLQQMHQVGLTTVLEAAGTAELLAVYAALQEKGSLTAKVSVALTTEAEPGEAQLARLEALRRQYSRYDHLRVDTVKIFADGVMEHPTQSAALLQPYLGADGSVSGSAGALYFQPEKMAALVSALDRKGFNVHVHAIGDAAVRASLDAFALARAQHGAASRAIFSISHLELIHPDDWPRFAALRVFASFQLLWARPDSYSVEAIQPYLGATRSQWLYPAAALHRAGAQLVAGSDWNVSSFDPWPAIAVGLCRCNADEPARPALLPDQALPLDVMLRAYTIEAARMLGRDQEIGSLTVGKAADLVVLARAPVADAELLRTMQVNATMVDGRWVYLRQP